MTTVDSPKPISPALDQAYTLLRTSIFEDLDFAESLADREWDDAEIDLVRNLIGDMVDVIRGLVMQHESTETGNCRACGIAWPCMMTEHIYALVKSPQRTYAEIRDYLRDVHGY